MSLLDIRNLTVEFKTAHGLFRAVDRVDLSIDHSEIVAIVGESGSGKSVAMLALMGLLPWTAKVSAERLQFSGHDLLSIDARARRRLVGKDYEYDFSRADDQLKSLLYCGFSTY